MWVEGGGGAVDSQESVEELIGRMQWEWTWTGKKFLVALSTRKLVYRFLGCLPPSP